MEKLTEYQYLPELPIRLLSEAVSKSKFKQIFQEQCSEIYAEIESIIINPNCSCAKKIREFTSLNRDRVAATIEEFFRTSDLSLDEFKVMVEKGTSITTSISGKILKTSVQKWTAFAEEIKFYTYKSFSITKDGDTLYVYFL